MPRKTLGKYDANSLSRIAERILKTGNSLLAVVKTIETNKIHGLEISGKAELERSLKAQDNFVRSAERSAYDVLQGAGVYVAPQEQLEKKIKSLEADLRKAKKRIADLESAKLNVAEKKDNYRSKKSAKKK